MHAGADRGLDQPGARKLEGAGAIDNDGAADLLEAVGARLLAVDMNVRELAVGLCGLQLALQRHEPRLVATAEAKAVAAAPGQQSGQP